MITSRQPPRARRFLAVAFILSCAIHLFGGALWANTNHFIARVMRRLPEQHEREQAVATSDAIHLERRAVPRPARLSRVPPAAKTAVMSQHAVERPPAHLRKPAPSAPQIAHVVKRAPRRPEPAEVVRAAGQPRLAARTSRSTATATLSAAQLAQLNAQFAQTIASSHLDLATIQKQIQARPVAQKRYPLQFTGMQASLERGEGYIEPTTMGERIGGTVWYYTHYTYMWPDGHLEDDDIPWPFRYPVGHDLFAMHVHLIPLQLPPPGFHLTRPLKPFLAHFLARAGQG